MIPLLASLVITILWILYRVSVLNVLSADEDSDAKAYIVMAHGDAMPAPFHYRKLLCRLIGASPRHWQCVSYTAIALTGPAVYLFCLGKGLTPGQAFLGVLLWLGLYGVASQYIREPIKPDALGIFLMVSASAAFAWHVPSLGIALSILCALCKETLPLFIALAASPLALLGFLAPLTIRVIDPPPPVEDTLLSEDPLYTASFPFGALGVIRIRRILRQREWQAYLWPWGAVLPLALIPPVPWVTWLALFLSYFQILVATDGARLFLLCFLTLLPQAVLNMPHQWVYIILILHLSHPYKW